MLHYQQNEQYSQLLPTTTQQQGQQHKQVAPLKVYYLRLNTKDASEPKAAVKETLSATMKTLAPNIRRRRRCERHHLELYHGTEHRHGASTSSPTGDVAPKSKSASTSPISDMGGIPAPPITPPPAFLSEGYKRSSTPCRSSAVKRSLGKKQISQLIIKKQFSNTSSEGIDYN